MEANIARGCTALLAAALASAASIASAAIPATERAVLTNLYTSTHGEGWVDATNWNAAPGSECTWWGIQCDAAGEHVVRIVLATNRLTGALPALDDLTELAYLDVQSNDCYRLSDLGTCIPDPNSNRLQGPPPPLAALAHFQRLFAHAAGFSGTFPSLAGLSTLITYDVGANALTGSLPAFDGLDALEDFLVGGNALTGSIPPLTLPNLRYFDVSRTRLTGPIPQLSHLARLETFLAQYTMLTGSVPSLAGLANLQSFDVDHSMLDGTIGSLEGLTNLGTFDVSVNALTGPIPALSGLTSLTVFNVQQNHLSGSIPSLSDAAALRYFMAWGNELSGPIPSLAGLTQLNTFNVAINRLTGPIPSLAGLAALDTFAVYSNQLTGPLPALAHQGLDALFVFAAYDNQLTGSIPSLEGLSNLTYFSVRDNRLTGTLPALSWQSLNSFSQFEADRNQLTGPIPDLTGSNLYIFTVSSNALTGTIPAIPSTLSQFDASDNRLDGVIPDLSHADALQSFNVGFNHLSGTIPTPAPRMDQQPNIMGISVCPNHLTPSPSATWDAIVGHSPWYEGCAASYVDPNQFGFTGAWYDTADPGKGFLIDAMPDHAAPGIGTYFGGWFNFLCGIYGCPYGTPDDEQGQQQWFSFQDNVDATNPYSRLTIYESRGGNFDAPPAIGATPVGLLAIAFDDCSHAMLRYHVPGVGIYLDRTVRLTRLTPSTRCTQDAAPPAMPASNTLLSGAWYDPTTAGQGLVFDINAENGVLFAAWYTFAADGADQPPLASQRWYTLQARTAGDSHTYEGVTIYDTTGGLFDAAWPPGEGDLQTNPVGSADIAFQSCSMLTINYRFTTGENAGKTGTLHLARLSPVPDGCVD